MQTFLPYSDFIESMKVLDSKRLGKQRVEAYQILNVLLERPRKDGKPYKGWVNHPCVRMWRGYEDALKVYINVCIDEWKERGFKNTMNYEIPSTNDVIFPEWLGKYELHSSHRSNLLRKDKEYYSKFGWLETDDIEYFWV